MFHKPRTPPPPLLLPFLRSLLPLLLLLPSVLGCSNPNDVNCQICPHSSRGNDISGFPRVTSAGHSTSSDLGHFDWLTCNSTGGDCHSYFSPLDPSYSPASDHSSPDNYVQSLLAYTTFAICCAFVAVVACLVFFVLRYFSHVEKGGWAGGRYPTAASTHPMSLGYGQNEKTGELQYSPAQRWGARAWMWLSVALLFVWVAVGWFEGGRHVQSNAKAVVTAPWPLMEQVQSTQPAVATLLTDMAEDVLAATITNIATALKASVDLPTLVSQLSVAEVALTSLPSVQPVQAAFVQLHANTSDINTTISTTLPLFTASFTNLTTLNQLASNLSTSLTTYQSLSSSLQSNLSLAEQYVDALNSFTSLLYDPMTDFGFVELVVLNLLGYSSLPTPAQLAPVEVSVQQVLALGAGESMNATAAESLFSGVLGLIVQLYDVPPYETAATEMATITAYMNESLSYGFVTNTAAYLNTSAQLIAQLQPLLSSIELQYAQLLQQLNVTLLVDAAVHQLTTMHASLAQLPSVDDVQSSLTVMSTLQSVVAQINNVLQPLNVLTTQFLSLPSSALLLSYESQLNMTVSQAQLQFADTIVNLQSVLSMSAALDMQSDVASIQQLSNVNAYLPLLRNSSFINSLPKLNTTLAHAALASYVPPLVQLNNLYLNTIATINHTVTSPYNQLGQLITNIQVNLSNTVTADLATFIGGYCANDPSYTIVCNDQTLCSQGAACLNRAVKRCALHPPMLCNYSTQCPTGDRCLIDGVKYAGLLSSMQSLWTVAPTPAATSTLLSQYEDIASTISNAALSTFAPLLSSSGKAVNASTLLISPIVGNVSAVQTTLAGQNTSAIVTEYNGVLTALAVANTSGALSAVSNVNATLSAIAASNVTAQLADIATTVTTLSTFLYSAYPTTFAPRLTTAAIDASYTGDDAVSSLTSYLAVVLTNITQYLATAPALTVLDVDAVTNTDGLREWLHLLYSPLVSQYGAYYYFASLYTNAFNSPASLTPTSSPSYTVTLSPDYQPYTNNTYCLTDTCLNNSVDYYWTHDISQTTQWNVHMSPSTVSGSLLLLPFFLALLGLLCTMLCWSYKWSNAVASFTAVVVFLLVPLVFVVAAFAFPLALMQGDVCHGGANALYDAMLARQDTLCTEWFDGVGTAEQCTISTANLNATVNVQAIVYDVASGNCNADYNDALDNAFESLRMSFATWPLSRTASLTDALASSSSIVVQPQLQAIIDSSAQVATQRLDLFLLTVQSTLTCTSLHSQLVAVQSSFCCSLTSSLYWAASAWFLIAFTLCCCQGPAAVYGSKRFSERLVGGKIAPGVLYDPHGEYHHEIQSGGPGGPGHDRTKLALMTADSEGGEIELVRSPKYTDSLLKGYAKGEGTPPSKDKKSMEQCVLCFQPTMLMTTLAACGHKVCQQCALSHVKKEVGKRNYPVLCPLSQLKRQGVPACQQPMADEDVTEGLSDELRNEYVQHKALAASIPAPTAPSSPVANGVSEEKTQSAPVPPVREALRDRYRPLPPRGGGGHTPNAHAFISTPGGSFSVLQHPMSHYAATGQGGTDQMAMTRTGGALYGTGVGTGTGMYRTMPGSAGATREFGFSPQNYNHTNASTGDRPRAGVAHHCPQPGCTGLADQRNDADVMAVCPQCGYRWCVQCDVPWHDDQTCEEAQQARRRAMEWEVELEMARQQMMMQQRRIPTHWPSNTATAFDGQSGMADVAEGNEREDS